ncbi:hypothetical protein IGI04_019179, partial [Brassica rapa subsp. trilocularis]
AKKIPTRIYPNSLAIEIGGLQPCKVKSPSYTQLERITPLQIILIISQMVQVLKNTMNEHYKLLEQREDKLSQL